MKVTDLEIKQDIEIAINKKQEKEYKLLGRYRPKIDGYKIFEYDIVAQELKEATFITSDTFVLDKGPKNKKLDTKPNCVYVEALNERNAIKRIIKGKIMFKS